MIWASIISVYVVTVGIQLVCSQAKARRLAALTWDNLCASLRPVSQDELSRWRSQAQSQRLEEINKGIKLVSGEGSRSRLVSRLESNSSVMIALASYCNNWTSESYIESVLAMRKHESRLKRATRLYRLSVFFRRDEGVTLRYLAKAANEYFEIVGCLLSLYRNTHIARYPRVRAACS